MTIITILTTTTILSGAGYRTKRSLGGNDQFNFEQTEGEVPTDPPSGKVTYMALN